MNDFVNENHRDVSLAAGCKDLIDVLEGYSHGPDHRKPFQVFIRAILYRARELTARVIVFKRAATGDIVSIYIRSIYFKAGETIESREEYPIMEWSGVMAELRKMAAVPVGIYPMNGTFHIVFKKERSTWVVSQSSADTDCILGCVEVAHLKP